MKKQICFLQKPSLIAKKLFKDFFVCIVPRIVNLITMRANTGPRGLTFMQLKPKLYFNIRALFFS